MATLDRPWQWPWVGAPDKTLYSYPYVLHPDFFAVVARLWFTIFMAVCFILSLIYVDRDTLFEHNPILEFYGSFNVCIFFDYEPARTFGALAWSISELALCFYVFLRGVQWVTIIEPPLRYVKYILVVMWVVISFLCILAFREVFVAENTNVIRHSIGFLLFLHFIIIDAFQNLLFVLVAYSRRTGVKYFLAGFYVFFVVLSTVYLGLLYYTLVTGDHLRVMQFVSISWVTTAVVFALVAHGFISLTSHGIEGELIVTGNGEYTPLKARRRTESSVVLHKI